MSVAAPFPDHRAAAKALLASGAALKQREGQFLGGIAFMADAPSPKQRSWLDLLLKHHDLPPVAAE
ncbi:MAG: hypothetical protein JO290_12845 [Sphingomonadaceae bacterium]|nr:hypothetical protein [Sphingomonadaceae bacterium]